jgi:outer membrane protein assembly factor BamB
MTTKRMARLAVLTVTTISFVALTGTTAPGPAGNWLAFRMAPSNNAVVDGPLRARWTLVSGAPISDSPTLRGSTLYIGNNRGNLDAIDVRSGRLVWTRHLSNALMSAPLLYDDLVIVGEGDEQSTGSAPGAVYVGMGPSALVALDSANGRLRWRTRIAGSAMPTPAVVDGVLVDHNGAGWLTGLDPKTGKHWYARNLHSIASMTAALPVGAGHFITIGVLDNAAWELRASNGATVWRKAFSGSGSGHGDCPPVSDGARVFCNYVSPSGKEAYTSVGATAVQHAYALDLQNGSKRWDVALQSGILPPRNEAAIPLLDGGLVYFGSALAPYMHALDATTGHVAWQTKIRGPVKGGSVIVGNTLYFGDLAGYLWALNKRTGAILGDKKMPSGFNVGSPIAAGETLIIGSRTGSVYAVPLASIAAHHDV